MNQRFTIDFSKLLGKGSFGVVYMADENGTPRVVKILERVNLTEVNFQMRNPALHKNILPVLDCYENPDDGKFYIFMPFYENGSIMSYMQRLYAEGLTVPVQQIMKWVATLASVLQTLEAAHIIYRGLKPENCMLNNDLEVFVADFGEAEAAEAATAIRGTPPFMAPQIINNHYYNRMTTYTTKSDIWGLGTSLYFMLTQKFAYKNTAQAACEQFKKCEQPDYNHPRITKTIRALMDKMIQFEEIDRISAADLCQYLEVMSFLKFDYEKDLFPQGQDAAMRQLVNEKSELVSVFERVSGQKVFNLVPPIGVAAVVDIVPLSEDEFRKLSLLPSIKQIIQSYPRPWPNLLALRRDPNKKTIIEYALTLARDGKPFEEELRKALQ